jgi:hypothetical protein
MGNTASIATRLGIGPSYFPIGRAHVRLDWVAQQALPVSTAPRTVTVRVRTLVVTAGMLGGVGLVWWAVAWASGMQPLLAGSGGTDPVGLAVAAKTPFVLGGTNLFYTWKPGGRFVVTLAFHNSGSVPVTITGVDSTPSGGWFGAISGPTLQNASADTLEPVAGRFHPARVPADGYRALAIVFHANPNPRVECGTVYSNDSATLHFTRLGIFHDTQNIPLGDDAFYLTRRC